MNSYVPDNIAPIREATMGEWEGEKDKFIIIVGDFLAHLVEMEDINV